MKKVFFILSFLFFAVASFAQNTNSNTTQRTLKIRDSIYLNGHWYSNLLDSSDASALIDSLAPCDNGTMLNITTLGATTALSAAANTAIIQAAIAAGYKSLYIPKNVTYNASSLSDAEYLGLMLYDENVQGYSFGKSASLRESSSTASHLTLKPQKPQGITGLWIQSNGSYPYTPDVTGTYHTLKMMFEDVDSQLQVDSSKNYSDVTFTLQDSMYNGYGGMRINSKSNGNFQGAFAPIEFTFQNSAYRAVTVANLQANVSSEGSYQYWNFGGRQKAFWYAGRATTAGQYIVVYFRVYKAATTGTTGATIPTHTSGTVSDGGVSWTYITNTSQAGGGGHHRPVFIFGDFGTGADNPAIGFPTVVAQFAEDAMMYPATKIKFLNGAKTEANSYISRLNQTSTGITVAADSTHYLSVSATRITTTGIPFVNDIAIKTSLATTLDVSGANQFSFIDASATSFTGFTNGVVGQPVFVTFTTANTTLVESGSLFLNGKGNITPAANDVLLFIIGSSSQARLVRAYPAIKHPLFTNVTGTTVGLSTTTYMVPGGGSSTTFAAEASRSYLCPIAGTVKELRLVTSGTQPASGALTITVRKNGVDQSIVITIPLSSTATSWSDLTNSFTVAAGDTISLKFVNAATAVSLAIGQIALVIEQ